MSLDDFLTGLSDSADNATDAADSVGGLINGVRNISQPPASGTAEVIQPIDQTVEKAAQHKDAKQLIDNLIDAVGAKPTPKTRLAAYAGVGLFAGVVLMIGFKIIKKL